MQLELPDLCPSMADVGRRIQTNLRPHFDRYRSYRSTTEFLSSPLFLSTREDIEAALHTVYTGGFSSGMAPCKPQYRVLAWNIERGKELPGQIRAFRELPYLRDCDVLLLTETDVGMARSGNVDVARSLARELGLNYAFVPCYLSLVNGSGVERFIEGENHLGLHGNAILSRYPIREPRRIALRNGIDKMKSNEQRLGTQTALAATVELPGLHLPVACVHLDANSTQSHRALQMRTILEALPHDGPALVGGDWNTTTFDSSTAFRAIMGYWRCVFMGPNRVINGHFLHPYNWFEKELFDLIEHRGFDFRRCNSLGDHTIFYDVENIGTHKGLAEWIPGWCFPFIRWALRDHGGVAPVMIDWFASRQVGCSDPRVVHEVRKFEGRSLSDHSAIGVEVRPLS
jgi:endonuclease/exonuclease/phosphatase family metal-dependent hydrolase